MVIRPQSRADRIADAVMDTLVCVAAVVAVAAALPGLSYLALSWLFGSDG